MRTCSGSNGLADGAGDAGVDGEGEAALAAVGTPATGSREPRRSAERMIRAVVMRVATG
jgi:hypothetical protein